MITYNDAFNDGYEQALEELGYVIDDREYMYDLDSFGENEYDTYAEEGLYDLDSFIDDDSAYENYDIDEAYYNGYYDALEALNLFKKKEPEPEPKKSGLLGILKSLVEKAIKLLTETIPNFFRRLFGKDPRYKNDPRVKNLNGDCKDLEKHTNRGRQILKGVGIVLGGAAALAGGYAGTKMFLNKTKAGKNIANKANNYIDNTSYSKVEGSNSNDNKTKYVKNVTDSEGNVSTTEISSTAFYLKKCTHKVLSGIRDIDKIVTGKVENAADAVKGFGGKVKDKVKDTVKNIGKKKTDNDNKSNQSKPALPADNSNTSDTSDASNTDDQNTTNSNPEPNQQTKNEDNNSTTTSETKPKNDEGGQTELNAQQMKKDFIGRVRIKAKEEGWSEKRTKLLIRKIINTSNDQEALKELQQYMDKIL